METFYSKEYSLSKMTTEEYIRDPRFQVIGFGIKVNSNATEWVTGTAKTVLSVLRNEIDWGNSALLAHNMMFDGAIMSWRCGIQPKALFDTLCMSRALYGTEVSHSLKAVSERHGIGEKGDEVVRALGKRRLDFTPQELAAYGKYCVNDVDLCYKLFQIMSKGFPPKEMRLIDLTLRMFTDPVLEIDAEHMKHHLAATQQIKEDLLTSVGVDKKELMSNPKFAELLKQFGVTPPMKISPTTGKSTYAFAKIDPGLKELQEHDDGRVQTLVAARLGTKSTLEESRTQRFIDIASRGKLPAPIRYYAAHTGRWGGCLVADTLITTLDITGTVVEKAITDVLPYDLVWDGIEFVRHEGVVFSGYSEVIEWDGVRGTEDHVVFTDAGEISLHDAMQGAHRITSGDSPDSNAVDAAMQYRRRNKV